MRLIIFLLACAYFILSKVDAGRILALIPYNARSHFVVMEPLLLALRERGHQLTVVSSFPQKPPLNNYTDIDLSSYLPPAISSYSFQTIRQDMPNLFQCALFIAKIHLDVCDKVLRDERIRGLFEQKFDLVIGEIFGSDCFNVIVQKIDAPLVSWVTSTMLPWATDRMGLPDNPSYIPNYFVDFGDKMTLLERVINTGTLLYAKTAYYFGSEVVSEKLTEDILGEKSSSLDKINRKTSMLFVNSHYSLTYSRPLTPNVVEVGGIHVKPLKPLPQDLKVILDGAKDGVILFSFGSLVRVATIPKQTISMFLDVFATLSQKIIMKYEEDLPDAPPNVIVRKWLPQSDLIGHANVRAVIAHGGLASTIEAVHYAKPLIGVPFYSDQFQNVKNVVRRGAGILLDIDNLNHKQLLQAFKQILTDPSYSENMRRLSSQFRDRPVPALDSAVFWTEYVMRHRSAEHLQPASKHLPFYQYLLLDILLLCALTFLSVCILVYVLVSRLCRCFLSRPTNSTVVKKKKTKKLAKTD